MKPELWERIAQLHRAVLEIEKGARAAFLTKACAGDEVLRREVESLLALEGNAENFMESSALEAVAEQLAQEHLPVRALNPGPKLESYEILGPLGAGGMGEVYRARDSKLNRDVALKILPAMFTDDAERMARFRREAQGFGSANHRLGFQTSSPSFVGFGSDHVQSGSWPRGLGISTDLTCLYPRME